MRRIETYLLRQLGWPTLAAVVALTTLAVLSQMLTTLNLIVDQRQSAIVFLKVVALSLPSTAVITFLGAAPTVVVGAVAGIALLGTLGSSLTAALADASARVPAAVAFVVAASGVSVHGIGAAFFALAAGLVAYALTREPMAPTTAQS